MSVYYGCDCCGDVWPAPIHDVVRVMPDGSWLCEICYDMEDPRDYDVEPVVLPGEPWSAEWPEWSSFPPPPEYGSVESVETKDKWYDVPSAGERRDVEGGEEMNLLEALEDIEANADNLRGGICVELSKRTCVSGHHHLEKFNQLAKSWPEFSGNRTYPVPGCDGQDECNTYCDAMMKGDLWKGEYGAARRRLLRHCIETLRGAHGAYPS